jgi:RHS repeat-associated protein
MDAWRSLSSRRRTGISAVVSVLAVLGSMAAAVPPAPYQYTGDIWSPYAPAAARSVPGHPLAGSSRRPGPKEPGVAAVPWRPAAAVWPAAAGGTAGLPVSAGGGTPAETVTLASHAAAVKAGVSGLIMTISAPGAAGTTPGTAAPRTTAPNVPVRVSYAGIAGNYGGGWASRLRLVEMPACALTTPGAPGCATQRPLATVNDPAAQSLTATVPLAAASSVVLAATAGPSGADGNYSATSLNPSGTWAVQNGDFTYAYPVDVPPSIGGSAPDVTLGYDSQSVDGETSGQNTQASWIGDGWSYSPGFIERSYKTCAKDGIANSADDCWGGDNATLLLGGHPQTLVRDDATGAWHVQGDDGTKVELLTGAANGLYSGEYWMVTTTDGTRYYLGLDHLPGGTGADPSSNAAWGVPVYSPNAGDPCHAAGWCQMAWRWNLDYVVDPHGNLQSYRYTPEMNYYDRGGGQDNGNGTLTPYVRGGYLNSISYGYRLTDAAGGAKPAAQVLFGSQQRCVSSSSYTCGTSGPTAATAANWPDVPFDQNCDSTGTCTNWGPTFWSTMRLDTITTKAGSATVDAYQLAQSYPDAGGASEPVMFLGSVTRTGSDGTAVSLPPVTFTPTEIDNRVDGLVPAAPPLYRPRISSISTETGSSVQVAYNAPVCSRVHGTMPASPDSNTLPCFPVSWIPPGTAAPIRDWFNKSLVGQVTVADETGITSPVQVTSYSYLGGAAWHQDASPVTDSSTRTWDQFRGYAQVITTTGAAPDPVTKTETTYLRGMNGDAKSGGGTQPASVPDSLGDSVTDDNWLAGQVLETDAYTASGGSVAAKQVNGPWAFSTTATQAMPGGLPALTAHMPQAEETRGLALLANGTWRTEQGNTSYNQAGQVVATDDKGDGSPSDPETCTTTSYATSSANPMMVSYPDEVTKVTGPCGTKPTAASTISGIRTFYDEPGTLASLGTFGAITGPGDATGTAAVTGYDGSGNPVFQPRSTATFDAYGRALTSTDANGNVTTTAFTPAAGALPAQTVATNPAGWVTTTALDQARQLPVKVTDPNGRVTAQAYDALGRLTAVWLPGRDQATQSPNETFGYAQDGKNPVSVTSGTLREDGSYSQDVKIYDGLLQLRQEQTTTANNSRGRLITDTFHDSHGWVVKTSAPYYDATTQPDMTVFAAADSQVPSQTVTVYDGQGRATATRFYSLAALQWQSAAAYPGADRVDVTPPPGGTATSTFTNGRGETTATWDYTTAAPTGKAADADVTAYAYTPAGNTAAVTDDAGNKWTYSYDLLGRKTSQSDPDAGTSSYAYDPNGNMTSSTDARGQVLTYTYDALNRKTAGYSGAVGPAGLLDSWSYDTLAKGLPTSSTAYSGGAAGAAYTEAVTGYDTAYQPTGTSVTIPSAEGALAGTYTTSSTYTPTIGLLNSAAYSADAGLPAETVGYSYDLQGLLNAYGGVNDTAYLDKTAYTPLGQVQRTTTGLFGAQLVQTESYDQGTSRLLQTTVNAQTASSAVDTENYTYNPAGDLTSISDAQGGTAQTDLQCFGYDNLERLVQAWTDAGGVTTAGGTSVAGLGGCTDTSPAQPAIGGPAPYWQTYSYDPLGDRTSEVQHLATGNITQTLVYPGNGTTPAAQPNAATSVTTTGPPGTSASASYRYDAEGNVTARSGPSALTLGYDPQGRASSVTTSSGTSRYFYGADGDLLIQRDPGQTILYLDGGAEELTLAGGTVTGNRYYDEPDGTTIVRSSAGTISYEVANAQGTGVTDISAATLAVTRRYYDPFGAPRGTAASAWPDQHGFVGQPADPSTSLDLLGARQYDPVTGRFLQVDPVFEAGDPRQMGGYSYAADNPATQADPAGTRVCPDGCDSDTSRQIYQASQAAHWAAVQQQYQQNLQNQAENQALDGCRSSGCFIHTAQLFGKPAYAAAQAARYEQQEQQSARITAAWQKELASNDGSPAARNCLPDFESGSCLAAGLPATALPGNGDGEGDPPSGDVELPPGGAVPAIPAAGGLVGIGGKVMSGLSALAAAGGFYVSSVVHPHEITPKRPRQYQSTPGRPLKTEPGTGDGNGEGAGTPRVPSPTDIPTEVLFPDQLQGLLDNSYDSTASSQGTKESLKLLMGAGGIPGGVSAPSVGDGGYGGGVLGSLIDIGRGGLDKNQ